ncbi:MAG: 1-acyl-sn-glycerol-3-phosphate acyltransferase [Candidatus Methanomethylophilaceae archaeon]|nr:1-acyl-sn-glycerol-3-phosphate acyltransferase [Candidatus Methanomethylophilaceae archaeon]
MEKREKKADQKQTLQERLAAREFHSPGRAVTWVYHAIGSTVLLPKYAPHFAKDSELPEKGPFILVWNHLSRLDHLYTMKAMYPLRYNMVAGYSEFFRSHLQAVFRLNQILPKKIYEQDIPGIKAIHSILRKDGIVAFSPEGMSSIYGTNQPVVPGSGRFIQYFRLPVYCLEMRGQYLTSTKHFLEERKGRTEARLYRLFTPEDLARMTPGEIDERLNEAFRHDEFEWTAERHIRWNMHGRSCEHLDEICYRCPKCGADLAMTAKGDRIFCRECGNGAVLNDYYEFEPFDEGCVIPASPSKWVEEERVDIIRKIREDPGYSVTERVELGDLPPYHLLTKKKTSEPCGSGEMTFDHQGIHFTGVRRNEPWHFDLSYSQVFSLVIMTSTARFALYVNGAFYEFTPDRRSVGKLLLVTEEMHRLHFNVWKNFPWCNWMYEGLPLGIDAAPDAGKQ